MSIGPNHFHNFAGSDVQNDLYDWASGISTDEEIAA